MSAAQDKVQGILQTLLQETLPLVHKGVFTQQQVQTAMCERQKIQNNMLKPTFKLSDYLRAIQFQYGLQRQRKNRIQTLAPTNPLFKKQAKTDFVIVRRIIKLWDRTMHKFKYNVELWKQYFDFCITTQSKKQFYKALSNALRFLPFCEDLWLIGIQYQIQIGFNMWKARKLFIKALRMNSKNVSLWTKMFKFEINFLKTLSQREKAIQGNKTIQFFTGNQQQIQEEQQKMRDEQEQDKVNKMNKINLQQHDEILFMVYQEALSKINEQDKANFTTTINKILSHDIKGENDKTVLKVLKKAQQKINQNNIKSQQKLNIIHHQSNSLSKQKVPKNMNMKQKLQYYQNYLASNDIMQTAQLDKIICQFIMKPNQLTKLLLHFLQCNEQKAIQYLNSSTKFKLYSLPSKVLQKIISLVTDSGNENYTKKCLDLVKKINANSYIQNLHLLETVIKFNKKMKNYKGNTDIHRSVSILCKSKPQIIQRCLHWIHQTSIQEQQS